LVKMVKCQVTSCTYKTEQDIEKTSALADHMALLNIHREDAHPKPPATTNHPASAPARTEKIGRPKLEMKDGSSTEEQWKFFTFSWEQYKTLANITGNEKETLGVCLGDTVASLVYSRLGDVKYKALTEVELLKEARQLVVKTRNKLVHRLKLGTMVQGGDEPITSFETRLQPVARTGRFQVECTACKGQADYTDQMVLDNLIRGLGDEEIKRKVLATPETDCTLAKVMRFVEAEESAKYSLSDSKLFDSVSGVSSFKRQQGGVVENEVNPPVNANPYFCHKCKTKHKHHTLGGICPAYDNKLCDFCKRKGHFKVNCKDFKRSQKGEVSKGDTKNKSGDEAAEIITMFTW
jgi:hypothetical protein